MVTQVLVDDADPDVGYFGPLGELVDDEGVELLVVGHRDVDEMSTGERTGAAKLNGVVIVDQSLSPGQAANAAVCVSAATAPAVPGLLGSGGGAAALSEHEPMASFTPRALPMRCESQIGYRVGSVV